MRYNGKNTRRIKKRDMGKITNLLLVCLTIGSFLACDSINQKEPEKIYFGIYNLYDLNDVPDQVVDSLMKPGFIKTKNKHLSIIGYRPYKDSIGLYQYNDGDFALYETYYTVDKDANFIAVVALNRLPQITIADLKVARNIKGNVELEFNETGKSKWEKMTHNMTGKRVAIVLGEYIYSIPYINKSISTGIAVITGIDDEISAERIAELLNNSIPKDI